MKTKMVGLFAVVMIALMVAGFAYAHWTETLVINGTVKTGELDLRWSCQCWDNDEPPLKDVGEISCDIEGDTLTITVTNAYPCYKVGGEIDIENVGTVPAVLKKYKITLPEDVTYDYNPQRGEITLYYKGVVMATGIITFKGDFSQIDAKETVYIDFTIHFTNPGLPENWSGTFTITLDFENWSPPPAK
jgi:hypothetical protein